MATLQNVFQIVLLFFVLVTIHEWGHYYFAKRAGILVREFAIGFGPKLLSFKKDETRYTLRLLPIGGFVRMAGEDPEMVQINQGQRVALAIHDDQITHIYLNDFDKRLDSLVGVVEEIDLEHSLMIKLDVDGEIRHLKVHPQAMMVSKNKETQIAPWNRQFGSKTVGQRSLSIFAGPMMNFILAFVLFVAVVFMAGVPDKVKIRSTEPGSPAEKGGLVANDIVLIVNNEPIGADGNKLKNLIKQSANKPMVWIVDRGGEQMRKEVTPEDKGGGLVGVTLMAENRKAGVTDGLVNGWKSMSSATVSILDSFGKLATLQFKMDDLGGPVRIVEFTSEQASAGIAQYTFWTALMSLYLGLFNLLPFPALDGSRLVFLGFEAIRGKPVDPSRESMVHFVGFAMLMLLMIAVTYNDILRLITG
ncbi:MULTISPECIES: RIP metalloprotease RseP [Paenibacillus]|uniref:Zinc metalloprotease n=1 Tax=Paenibacillus radicis (ex Xue et al. 2023) TaxID=2972489 RepID=A0ABT1YC50_9BACL|nr:RIP metalloprotease RseP [Paenibacillus radicis (ex Xue et al. 2023)]MCR8630775.1 RIP metalloprotease RseP [Paenibacillus radicis (ex Xue et al. 2023)]